MLAFHLVFPTALLSVLWHGRNPASPSLKDDLPIFAVPVLFHLLDIGFAIAGGFTQVLPLILASGIVHLGLLGLFFFKNAERKAQVRYEIRGN